MNPFGDGEQWYYSIGGKNLPSTPVKTSTEAAAELCMALYAFGAHSHTSLITMDTWVAAKGTYLIAADLEIQPHKLKLSESGITTLSTNTYLIINFSNVLAKPFNVQTLRWNFGRPLRWNFDHAWRPCVRPILSAFL